MFDGIKFKLSKINPFRKIGYGYLGKKSFIYKPIMICGKKNLFLGDNTWFRNGARIEVVSNWQNQKFDSKIKIGNNTSFEQNCHITSAGDILIGDNCVFSARVMITNIDHAYTEINKNILLQPLIIRNVKIGNNCFIGMDAKIFPGVTIGDNVIVGANSIVMKDVPSYSVVVGNPARVIKKYDFETNQWVKVR